MNKVFAIDRFEADLAVLEQEDGVHLCVLRAFLPPDAREGERIAFCAGHWEVRKAGTGALRDELFDLQESLFDA